jgi:hypothetical protein
MATRSSLSPLAGRLRPTLLEEFSIERRAVVLPALICLLMGIVGSTAGKLAGMDGTRLLLPYFLASFSITLLSVLVFMFIEFSKLALRLAPNPIQTVWGTVRVRLPYLIVPLIVFPVFLTSFSTAKSSIPALVGYHWDGFWANADVLIFRTDAWKIAHAIYPHSLVRLLEWFYVTVWVLILALFGPNVAIYSTPRRIGVMFTAMLLTWVIAGWLLAYCFSASGPIFVPFFDISLAERFAPLRDAVYNSPWGGDSIRRTQEYLSVATYASFAVKGGGISAMPSMHLGMTSIYVLAARGTKWLLPAIVFWMIVFLGSAYFGYHYWIDGIVAAGVAWGCWQLAERFFPANTQNVIRFAPMGSLSAEPK